MVLPEAKVPAPAEVTCQVPPVPTTSFKVPPALVTEKVRPVSFWELEPERVMEAPVKAPVKAAESEREKSVPEV